MSAVKEVEGKPDVVKVLFALHEGFDTLDFAGPFEAFSQAKHLFNGEEIPAFKAYTAGQGKDGYVASSHGLKVKVDMDEWEEAQEELSEFDMLVVVGGNTNPLLDSKVEQQPIPLIKAFAELQTTDPSKERTLFSVCTGSLLLAKAGILQGLAATTHPNFYTKLEIVSQTAAQNDTGILTDVMEERYVVNNARYELGSDLTENPFVFTKKSHQVGAAVKKARRGSEAFKLAKRRESFIKRSNLPLGGLRVVTSGGIAAGIDAALYLVAAHIDVLSAEKLAHQLQFHWQKGVTVEAIDV